MSKDSTWKPAYDCVFIINGVTMQATTGSFSESVEEFDVTNTVSAGDYEFGAGVTTRKLQMDIPVDSSDVRIPALKSLVPGSFSDGISTYSGNLRITGRDHRGGGKGAYTLSLSGTFTGAITTS